MEPEYSVNDIVATVYNYVCNSGRVIDVSWFDADNGRRIVEYLVKLDVLHYGDGDDNNGNEVVFQADELVPFGITQIKLGELLDKATKL